MEVCEIGAMGQKAPMPVHKKVGNVSQAGTVAWPRSLGWYHHQRASQPFVRQYPRHCLSVWLNTTIHLSLWPGEQVLLLQEQSPDHYPIQSCLKGESLVVIILAERRDAINLPDLLANDMLKVLENQLSLGERKQTLGGWAY